MANIQTRIPSQHKSLAYLQHHYNDSIASGLKRPLVFPQLMFSLALLAAFLLIDHRQNRFLYHLRWPVWFIIIAFEVSNIRHSISVEPAISYVSGVASVWCIVWSSVWLIFNCPQFTAKHIERRRMVLQNGTQIYSNGSTGQCSEATGYKMNGNDHSVQTLKLQNCYAMATSQALRPQNGHAVAAVHPLKQQEGDIAAMPTADKSLPEAKESNEKWEYYWQSYPDAFGERLLWVLDLMFSFRGHGWNFSIPNNPAVPTEVATSLSETAPKIAKPLTSKTGIKCFRTRKDLARYAIPMSMACYVVLDLCKLQIIHDPFFRTGDATLPAPAYLEGLPEFLIIWIRRNTIIISLVVVIELHALLLPIFFSLLLGPRVVGIRGEPWMYPTTWGSPATILEKGLGGFWGGWWHQTFRLGFSAPTNYLIRRGWLRRKTITGKLVGLIIAFVISGAMHSVGSFVQPLPTHPLRQLTFFLLQIIAVTAQSVLCAALRPLLDRLPKWVRQTGNGVFTYLWLYATCPLFTDDMSTGGSWMYEPLMVSPLRWLGFGPEGYGWWTWAHVDVKWHSGRHWWESGIGGL